MVFYGMRKPPVPPIEFPPPSPPYKHYVAGAGTVEAASEDINIGTPFNEIVTKVYVKVGDHVEKETPLFQLNIRSLESQLEEAKQNFDVATVNYEDQKTQLTLFSKPQRQTRSE